MKLGLGFPFRERARYVAPPDPDPEPEPEACVSTKFLMWDDTVDGFTVTKHVRVFDIDEGDFVASATPDTNGNPRDYEPVRAAAVNGGVFGLFNDVTGLTGWKRAERWDVNAERDWRFYGGDESPEQQVFAAGNDSNGNVYLLTGNASASSWSDDPELRLRRMNSNGTLALDAAVSASWLPAGLEFNLILYTLTLSPNGGVAVASIQLYDQDTGEYHAYMLGISTTDGAVLWSVAAEEGITAPFGFGTTGAADSLFFVGSFVDVYPYDADDGFTLLVRYDFTGGWTDPPSETWRKNPTIDSNVTLGVRPVAVGERVFVVAFGASNTPPVLTAFDLDGDEAWTQTIGDSSSSGWNLAALEGAVVVNEYVTPESDTFARYRFFDPVTGDELSFSPVGGTSLGGEYIFTVYGITSTLCPPTSVSLATRMVAAWVTEDPEDAATKHVFGMETAGGSSLAWRPTAPTDITFKAVDSPVTGTVAGLGAAHRDSQAVNSDGDEAWTFNPATHTAIAFCHSNAADYLLVGDASELILMSITGSTLTPARTWDSPFVDGDFELPPLQVAEAIMSPDGGTLIIAGQATDEDSNGKAVLVGLNVATGDVRWWLDVGPAVDYLGWFMRRLGEGSDFVLAGNWSPTSNEVDGRLAVARFNSSDLTSAPSLEWERSVEAGDNDEWALIRDITVSPRRILGVGPLVVVAHDTLDDGTSQVTAVELDDGSVAWRWGPTGEHDDVRGVEATSDDIMVLMNDADHSGDS